MCYNPHCIDQQADLFWLLRRFSVPPARQLTVVEFRLVQLKPAFLTTLTAKICDPLTTQLCLFGTTTVQVWADTACRDDQR